MSAIAKPKPKPKRLSPSRGSHAAVAALRCMLYYCAVCCTIAVYCDYVGATRRTRQHRCSSFAASSALAAAPRLRAVVHRDVAQRHRRSASRAATAVPCRRCLSAIAARCDCARRLAAAAAHARYARSRVCLRQWLCARERPSCSLLHKTVELHRPTEQRRSDGLKPHRPPHGFWAQCTLLAAAVCDRHWVVTNTIDKLTCRTPCAPRQGMLQTVNTGPPYRMQ